MKSNPQLAAMNPCEKAFAPGVRLLKVSWRSDVHTGLRIGTPSHPSGPINKPHSSYMWRVLPLQREQWALTVSTPWLSHLSPDLDLVSAILSFGLAEEPSASNNYTPCV